MVKPNLGKLLFVVTKDWYFFSHRLQLAIAAKKAGFDVAVVTQETAHGDVIRESGIRLIPMKFKRSGKNLLSDFMTIVSLIKIYREERPELLHHVSLKPVLYGSIAASLVRTQQLRVINAMTGLGFIFSSEKFSAKVIRSLISLPLKKIYAAKNTVTIFQNADDLKTLRDLKIIDNAKTVLIRGSGVDINSYIPSSSNEAIPKVILCARMLWDKGVGEFVEAAKLLSDKNIKVEFILVGDTDHENPSAIPVEQLEEWQKEGVIIWLGKRNDIPELLAKSFIACLPSYREGLPKFLLEAAASGLPIVTTDVPGCREIVIDNENGYLVPVRNHELLANAIEKLIDNRDSALKMGARGREIVERQFTADKVIDETISLYQKILS